MLNVILIIVFLVTQHAYGTQVFDCTTVHVDENCITIKETDLIGTEVVFVNNTFSKLKWEVSFNNTPSSYFASFFTLVHLDDHSQAIRLNKVIDLELLQVEHPVWIQLPDFREESLVLQLGVGCQLDTGTINKNFFNIIVRSVNEFSPYFLGAPFKVSMSETAELGTVIYDLGSKAVDLDAGKSNLTFKIAPYIIYEFDGSRWVAMDPDVKGRIVLSLPLDFESLRVRERAYFFLNVTVTDEGGYSSSTSIQVGVQDANDQSIEFVYPKCARPCVDVNYSVNTNESYVGILDVLPVNIVSRDLDTLDSTIEYLLFSDDGDFYAVDRVTGQLSKIAPLVNDTYGYNTTLLIKVREIENHDHSVMAEVMVFIDERNLGFIEEGQQQLQLIQVSFN